MQRLLLQFTDAGLADFRWARFDPDADPAVIPWQSAGAEELSAVAAQNPLPVVMIIPQQCVYLTSVELPEKATRQLLSAIEFQVEDQLAQDIESQHFALGDTSQNPISLAVVDKSIMDTARALAQGHGLRVVQILPELFLCPWRDGDGVNLVEGHDGCLLRYGAYRGLKCHAQALPAMLELVRRDVDFERIAYYAGDSDETPTLDGYEVERRPLASIKPGLVDAPLIDLQQREYQLSSAWKSLGRAWKWIAILVVALLVVGGYNRAIALQELEAELAAVRAQQYALVKPFLPAETSPDDNLKKILIARLNQLQANQREQGFLQLLLDFSSARVKYPDVDISRIGYQGSQLNIDISSQQLRSIEALHQDLVKQGVAAKLENLSIKPERSSGRLVLEGGDDA